MTVTPNSPEEIYKRVKNLYEQHIRAQVENAYDGKIIMIDTASSDYEIDDVGVAASERLRQRHPNAILCALRIGYEAVDGFSSAPRIERIGKDCQSWPIKCN